MPEVLIGDNALPFDIVQIDTGLTSEITGNTVSIGLDRSYVEGLVMGSFVYSINGQAPASDGSFYIHGSDCDSWDINRTGDGIDIVDLCPACQTCDTLYDIKQGLEQLNVMLNMLKDIELYKTPTLAGHKSGLESLCIDGGTNCAGPWELDAIEMGRQLLQQYTTVVHMWNYAVLQNNSSLRLEIAPEDTAGFVVQTKRALPSCDESMQIKCTITVSYEAVVPDPQRPSETPTVTPSKQLLSVLIPSPILRFKPFTLEETVDDLDITAGGSMRDGEEDTKHIAALQNIDIQVINDPDYTTKTITTGWITAKIAGTYEFTVKVLPFIHCVMTDDQGNVISVRGGDIVINGQTVSGEIYYNCKPHVSDIASTRLVSPTMVDYLDSKSIPTASVPFFNIWRVHIQWDVREVAQGGQEYTYEETRLYTCTGVRNPNTAALLGNTAIIVDPPEPEPQA